MVTRRNNAEQAEIVIIGGGIAGLAALHRLSGHDALLLEAEDRCGGRILSRECGGYWVNLGAHILSSGEGPMVRLARELDVGLLPIRGRTNAVWHEGRLLKTSVAETYPFRLNLPPAGRLSMIRTGLRLRAAFRRATRSVADPIHGARDFTGSHPTVEGDERLDAMSMQDLFGAIHPSIAPLFHSAVNRLGAEPRDVSASFGASVIGGHLRGSGSSALVTPHGGMASITDALVRRHRDRIRTGIRVVSASSDEDGCTVIAQTPDGVRMFRSKAVIMAVPAHVASGMVPGLPERRIAALRSISYGPYITMAVVTTETAGLSYDDVYAITVAGRRITMIFNAANPQRTGPQRRSGGVLMAYAAADKARALFDLTDQEIEQALLRDLHEILPETKGIVGSVEIRRWRHGYPYWRPGRLGLQDDIAAPFGRIYFAGDHVEYPSTDPAARSGETAAAAVMARLRQEQACPVI